MPLEAGTELSGYTIVEPIDSGGMGEVYRARDRKLGRDVAVKVLPEGLGSSPKARARFEREAKLLASLSHPGVAAVHGWEEVDGQLFLVMELIEGETLAERLSRGPLDFNEARPLFEKIADALEAAHERGILHRDLKPSNVMLTRAGPKLIDFGLAKSLRSAVADPEGSTAVRATEVGAVMGTPGYMSPEQARAGDVDRRTDVWSFGVMLFEALAGRAPFRGDSPSDALAAVLTEEPNWSLLPPAVPYDVERLIRRCVRKDLGERLRDVGDARLALEDAGDAPSATSHEASHQRWLWGAGGIALGLTAAFMWGLLDIQEQAAAPLWVSLRLPEGVALEGRGNNSSIAVSPSGGHVAFAVSDERGPRIFLRDLTRSESLALPGTEGGELPFFAPDGRSLGFFKGRTLYRLALSGGAPVEVADLPISDVRGAVWGEELVYFNMGFQDGLWSLDVASGQLTRLTTVDTASGEESHRFPHLLPDGEALLFVVDRLGMDSFDDAEIWMLDLETGERRVIIEGGSAPMYSDTGHVLYTRDGSLLATPFDAVRREVTGSPRQILTGVTTEPLFGHAEIDIGAGILVYAPGGPRRIDRRVVRFDGEGRAETVLDEQGSYFCGRVSPDGRHLVMNVEGLADSVWLFDLDRGTLTPLATEADNAYPIWHPDGEHVTFASTRGGSRQIFHQRADGSAPAVPLTRDMENPAPGSWSPDGRTLAFTTPEDIWLLTIDEAPALLVDAKGYRATNPSFSPDGRWIAYQSNESGRYEVFARELATGRRVPISNEGGTEPLWAPDGGELYYTAPDRHLMAVRVGGSGLDPAAPRALFELPTARAGARAPRYDVLPDGSGFIAIEERGELEAVTSLSLISGWQALLTTRH